MPRLIVNKKDKDSKLSGDVPDSFGSIEDNFEDLIEDHFGTEMFELGAETLLGKNWVERGLKIVETRTPEFYNEYVKKYATDKRTT